MLHANNIRIMVVPANCTDKLQPIDLTINKPLKDSIRKRFKIWCSQEIRRQLDSGVSVNGIKIDVRMSAIKLLSASWLMSSILDVCSRPQLAISGFRHAGITGALQVIRSSDSL